MLNENNIIKIKNSEIEKMAKEMYDAMTYKGASKLILYSQRISLGRFSIKFTKSDYSPISKMYIVALKAYIRTNDDTINNIENGNYNIGYYEEGREITINDMKNELLKFIQGISNNRATGIVNFGIQIVEDNNKESSMPSDLDYKRFTDLYLKTLKETNPILYNTLNFTIDNLEEFTQDAIKMAFESRLTPSTKEKIEEVKITNETFKTIETVLYELFNTGDENLVKTIHLSKHSYFYFNLRYRVKDKKIQFSLVFKDNDTQYLILFNDSSLNISSFVKLFELYFKHNHYVENMKEFNTWYNKTYKTNKKFKFVLEQ